MISNRLAEAGGYGGAMLTDANGTDQTAFWNSFQPGDTIRFDWPGGDWLEIGFAGTLQDYLPVFVMQFQPPEVGSGLQPEGPVTVSKVAADPGFPFVWVSQLDPVGNPSGNVPGIFVARLTAPGWVGSQLPAISLVDANGVDQSAVFGPLCADINARVVITSSVATTTYDTLWWAYGPALNQGDFPPLWALRMSDTVNGWQPNDNPQPPNGEIVHIKVLPA